MSARILIALIFLCTACTKTPYVDTEEVCCLVNQRLYSDGFLDADRAVEWALIHNPRIQATFEELGIANAEVVEAGLLTNPAFELEVRYPESRRCLCTNIEYLITGSVLDLFLRPVRVRVAETEYEKVKLRVSQEILDLAFEVRSTYYSMLFERKKIACMESIADMIDILGELSSRQHAVDNINALDLALAQSEAAESKLALQEAKAEWQRLVEKLNRLLGCPCSTVWAFPEELPETIATLCSLEELQEVALSQRLDLEMARMELDRLYQKLGLHRPWVYTDLRGGLAGEREPDGDNLVGFGLAGDIPLFNYGQAARLKLYAQLNREEARYESLQIEVLSKVREAYRVVEIEGEMCRQYRAVLLPVKAELFAKSEELYSMMALGIDRLLENKLQQSRALENYYECLRKYWMARVELEQSIGGGLLQ